jgi:hypothetical protein
MKQHILQHLRGIGFCIVGFVLMIMFTACAGVNGTGTGSTVSVTGSVQSVDTANGSITLSVQGQSITIKGLTSTQVAAIQPQVGKVYTITATQNSDGSYNITNGSNPVNDDSTPGVTQGIQTETPNNDGAPGVNEPGSISFVGKVQSATSSSIVVSMPNGQNLSMSIVNGQTDLSDFNGVLPSQGQMVKVDATANSNGSFTATKLGVADNGDLQVQNVVNYQGVTTSAVSSDNVIHLKVGNQSFSFTINSATDLGDFNNNAQSIGTNQTIKLEVLFQGATGTVQKVSN